MRPIRVRPRRPRVERNFILCTPHLPRCNE
jgi:hypothetical protein